MIHEDIGLDDLTINIHLTRRCNFSCHYCYAAYKGLGDLPLASWLQILHELADCGLRKVNFAGGEPLLFEGIGELLRVARGLGLITSIVTNGSQLGSEWVQQHFRYLDVVAISLDSGSETIQRKLGRGRGNVVEMVKAAWRLLQDEAARSQHRCVLKINTVVTRDNLHDDPSDVFIEMAPDRVKLLQFSRIEGENDTFTEQLAISADEFDGYVSRIRPRLEDAGIVVIPESEGVMQYSYLILDPAGRFCDKRGGRNRFGPSVVDVGVAQALRAVFEPAEISELRRNMGSRDGFYPTHREHAVWQV